MNILELFTKKDCRDAIEQHLITIRQHGGLEIWNYSPAAAYTDGAWDNPVVRGSRGLIINSRTMDIVARPWSKFFNYGQAEAGLLDMAAPVEVTDKLDGSLGILYRDAHGLLSVATRGSMQSDQALHATSWLRWRYELTESQPRLRGLHEITPLVEIIYPENRIVVDYGDKDELVLIGGVEIESGRYLSPITTMLSIGWEHPVVKIFEYATLHDALEAPPRKGAEGLCVRFLGRDKIVKIKQEDYVQLHKIVTGLSEKSVWRHMVENGVTEKSLETLLAPLPDELHEWTRATFRRIAADLLEIENRAKTTHESIIELLFDRKAYAQIAQQHTDVRPYLFMLLDGKDITGPVLRSLEPRGSSQPRTYEESE